MWDVSTTVEFDEWFSEQDEDTQAELIAKVELLKLFGPKLGRPHADTLNGSKHANMKELRASLPGKVLRVAFVFDPERTGILLVAGNKSGIKQTAFYKKLVARADSLFDDHLKALKEKENRNN